MVFQSWRKNRSEDHDTWSESCCCNMRGEVHDTWSESCCCNMRRKDTAKKRRRDNDVSLNDDLLEEIMSRLPVKALTRFQVVSKQWRRRIKSKYFMDRHMTITLTTMSLDWSSTSCLVQEGPAVYHIEPQIDQHARLSGSCDGLVCIFDENNLTSPIIVANPAMVRSQVLPLSQFQRQWKDDVTGTYKLVWLHNNQSNYTLSCEVFDFEVRKWRYVVVNTPSDDVPVFSKGWLYWIIANLTNYEYKILGYFPPTSYICFLVGKGLGFGSAFTGLSNSIFIPYFQSLLSIIVRMLVTMASATF
ncbi:hypothetical protein HID58_006993, partial [Brassica napus]